MGADLDDVAPSARGGMRVRVREGRGWTEAEGVVDVDVDVDGVCWEANTFYIRKLNCLLKILDKLYS